VQHACQAGLRPIPEHARAFSKADCHAAMTISRRERLSVASLSAGTADLGLAPSDGLEPTARFELDLIEMEDSPGMLFARGFARG
jgi:hypothetical protein